MENFYALITKFGELSMLDQDIKLGNKQAIKKARQLLIDIKTGTTEARKDLQNAIPKSSASEKKTRGRPQKAGLLESVVVPAPSVADPLLPLEIPKLVRQ